jgi:hypothetical protein
MKTKGKPAQGSAPKNTSVQNEAPKPTAPAPEVKENETLNGDVRATIGWLETPDGKIQLDRMTDKTKKKFRSLLDNPEFVKAIGIEAPSAAPSTLKFPEIDDKECNMILDLLGTVSGIGASFIYKVPREITMKAFQYTPDMRRKINPNLAAVLNKWAPTFLKTYKDEVGLGIVMFGAVNAQLTVMKLLDDQRKKAETRTSPRPVSAISSVAPNVYPAKTEEPLPAESASGAAD